MNYRELVEWHFRFGHPVVQIASGCLSFLSRQPFDKWRKQFRAVKKTDRRGLPLCWPDCSILSLLPALQRLYLGELTARQRLTAFGVSAPGLKMVAEFVSPAATWSRF